MKEKGVFRTKLFGGFNKKDVLEYFDELQKAKDQKGQEAVVENESLKEQMALKTDKINELLDKVEQLNKKIADLEKENAELVVENNKNNNLESALFEANKALAQSEDYKIRFEEVTRKVLKIKSDLIVKESDFKKLESKYNALKTEVDMLPSIDEKSLFEAKDAIDIINQFVNDTQKLNYSINRIKE